MYNNLIYFLLVLLVFSIYQPEEAREVSAFSGPAIIFFFYMLYWFWSRFLFRRLVNQITRGTGASYSLIYNRLITRMSIGAIIFFSLDVHFFGLKDLILALPVVGKSTALTGFLGLVFFAIYLCLLWWEAFQAYFLIYSSKLNKPRFVWSQLRFNLPIILPYFGISLIADLTGLLPDGALKAWLDSPVGEMVYVLVFMLVLVIFFPLLIKPLWGLTPLPEGPARKAIEDFCEQRGFKYRDIMLWPLYEGEGLTAGVMGLTKRWRYLLITNSLLRILDREEMDAVMGHEFGHVEQRHLIFYFLFFIGYIIAAYPLFDFLIYFLVLAIWAIDLWGAMEQNPGALLSVIMAVPFLLLMILYFRFVFGYFMRNFERQADLFSFKINGTVRGLVGSLEKIAYYSGQSRSLPSWHHFSVAQRVDFLNECESDPSLVKKHDRKVRSMIVVYFLALALIWGGGHLFKEKGIGEKANQWLTAIQVFEANIRQKNPNTALNHLLLGEVYRLAERPEKAIASYERALALAPMDPEILNHLAWTLATKENPTPKEKSRALNLAYRAVMIKPAPHILDTMAEALYLNDLPDEALELIDRALARVGPQGNREYYLSQKEKFKKAVDEKKGRQQNGPAPANP